MLYAEELIKCYGERRIECYIVYAILVILERNKTVFSVGKHNSFRTLSRTMTCQNWENDVALVALEYKYRHFRTSEKPNLINVIFNLMYFSFKIRGILPSRLVNINKLGHSHSFVYLICNSLGNISRILN